MIYDPHESYNPNFPEKDWKEYQQDTKTLEISSKVKELVDSGMVAVVRRSMLNDISFDLRSRMGEYTATDLQVCYEFKGGAHWTAMAISMLTHSSFEPNYEEDVIRFYKSNSPNPIMFPPNITFIEDVRGRRYPIFKKDKLKKSLEQFEF